MATAYIALGSNLGDRAGTLRAALQRLRAEPGLRLVAYSKFYETPPVGGPADQPAYLNAAATLETDRQPEALLEFLHAVEAAFGRVRTVQDGPRTLDLDLLLYDDRAINNNKLIIPHPRLHERGFVLVPLADVAPDAVHPILKRTVRQLLSDVDCSDIRESIIQNNSHTRLHGLRCLVTGSTAGIGAAIANEFIREGACVITHGRSHRAGQHIAADLSDPAACDRLAEQAWGTDGLDVLVCNAGADTLTGAAAKWSFERKLDALLTVDLKATMRLSRDIGARMKARGRGVILTVGWDQAETGFPGESGQLFAAVKGAIMAFTRSLALELAPQVRVNCLAPGWIRTAWGETAPKEWQERVRRETPLGVWGLPEDVAAAAVWLASPAAAFQTGQTVRVNGGAVRK
jgi:3-oxoacyl-[acyl-carrier protein] reductase